MARGRGAGEAFQPLLRLSGRTLLVGNLPLVARRSGGGSMPLVDGRPSPPAEADLMHAIALGEGERFSHEAVQPLTQRRVPSLHVAGLSAPLPTGEWPTGGRWDTWSRKTRCAPADPPRVA